MATMKQDILVDHARFRRQGSLPDPFNERLTDPVLYMVAPAACKFGKSQKAHILLSHSYLQLLVLQERMHKFESLVLQVDVARLENLHCQRDELEVFRVAILEIHVERVWRDEVPKYLRKASQKPLSSFSIPLEKLPMLIFIYLSAKDLHICIQVLQHKQDRAMHLLEAVWIPHELLQQRIATQSPQRRVHVAARLRTSERASDHRELASMATNLFFVRSSTL